MTKTLNTIADARIQDFSELYTHLDEKVDDYDLLASKVAEANASLPAPRVAVDEIATVANQVDVIESNSSF